MINTATHPFTTNTETVAMETGNRIVLYMLILLFASHQSSGGDRWSWWRLLVDPGRLPGFSVTAHWAFIWFLDGNENKVVISIVGTNGKYFLINAHGVLRWMGAVTEIPGS